MTGTKDERAVPGTAPAGSVVALRPAPGKGAPPRAVDAAVQDRIGRGLRLHYADVLALPIPDRLLTLLDALARSDTEAQP